MKKILLMAVVSTTGMTLFSYLLSVIFKEKFLETAQLNRLAFPKTPERKKHHPFGYILHYLVGAFFSAFYYSGWKKSIVKSNSGSGFLIGLVNGIIGIAGWNTVFLLHPEPPKVNRLHYYSQLLAAHVLFGFLNWWTYSKFKKVN